MDGDSLDVAAQLGCCLNNALKLLCACNISYNIIEQAVELDKLPKECRDIIEKGVKKDG